MENIFCVATRPDILTYTCFHCIYLSTKVFENFKDLLNSVRKPALRQHCKWKACNSSKTCRYKGHLLVL